MTIVKCQMAHCRNCENGLCQLDEIEILPVFNAKGYCKEFRFKNPKNNTMEQRFNDLLDKKHGEG